MTNIDIDSIDQLSPEHYYIVSVKPDTQETTLRAFAKALQGKGIRCLLTSGDVKVRLFADVFREMSPDDKKMVAKSLGFIDNSEDAPKNSAQE